MKEREGLAKAIRIIKMDKKNIKNLIMNTLCIPYL